MASMCVLQLRLSCKFNVLVAGDCYWVGLYTAVGGNWGGQYFLVKVKNGLLVPRGVFFSWGWSGGLFVRGVLVCYKSYIGFGA